MRGLYRAAPTCAGWLCGGGTYPVYAFLTSKERIMASSRWPLRNIWRKIEAEHLDRLEVPATPAA